MYVLKENLGSISSPRSLGAHDCVLDHFLHLFLEVTSILTEEVLLAGLEWRSL